MAHRVVEQGELINEVALVGDPASLGTDLASVEAQEVCTVATCSQSACVAVLAALGLVDTVREMAERRNAVQAPAFLRNVGFADASPAGLCVLAHAARALVLEKSASPYDSLLADSPWSDSAVFVILQGRVRVHGGRRGTKDLGPGEHFHRRAMSDAREAGADAYADGASVASPHAVLFVVDAAHVSAHDRPGTAQVRARGQLPASYCFARVSYDGGLTMMPFGAIGAIGIVVHAHASCMPVVRAPPTVVSFQ